VGGSKEHRGGNNTTHVEKKAAESHAAEDTFPTSTKVEVSGLAAYLWAQLSALVDLITGFPFVLSTPMTLSMYSTPKTLLC